VSIEIGSTVGDYQVVELIGRGGMGKIFKVRNVISDRFEAMKVLLTDAGETPDLAERFLREIKVVASLEHPNIASLRTALRFEDHLLMIMELVEGASLDAKLREGKLGVGPSIDIMCQTLAALSYAHQRGVIHRDVKPANILITPSGLVKLTDFGIASKVGDARLTATGMALGSLYYMSPEQVSAGPVGARSDIYSAGLTFYEAVTGRRPIDGTSFYAIMKAQLEQKPIPPVELSPEIPTVLSRVIEKSIEKDPANRYQTADEFRSALLSLSFGTAPSPVAVKTSIALAATGLRTGAAKDWNQADLEKAKTQLALYIGPMARVLVAHAAKTAGSLRELYDVLAAEIPSAIDRQKFLASRPVS
jgi:eukaryotic-like serine/threonine-protein kinase